MGQEHEMEEEKPQKDGLLALQSAHGCVCGKAAKYALKHI